MADKITAPIVHGMKGRKERIVCVTAYDLTSARIADASGADLILVGDSLGNVILGYDSTVPVTMDEMLHHTRAVRRGVRRALLVADMPFGSYQASTSEAVSNAVALVKAGAEAVKLESAYTEAIRAIVAAGIPVMGHVGMTPQSVNRFGGFRVQGKGSEGESIVNDAKEVDSAGVFSMVLELIPASLAGKITATVSCPTVGIGAGPHCDGQIQVYNDILGFDETRLKHAKRYAEVGADCLEGLKQYAEEVRKGEFPKEEHSF